MTAFDPPHVGMIIFYVFQYGDEDPFASGFVVERVRGRSLLSRHGSLQICRVNSQGALEGLTRRSIVPLVSDAAERRSQITKRRLLTEKQGTRQPGAGVIAYDGPGSYQPWWFSTPQAALDDFAVVQEEIAELSDAHAERAKARAEAARRGVGNP